MVKFSKSSSQENELNWKIINQNTKTPAESTFFFAPIFADPRHKFFAFLDPNRGWTRFSQPGPVRSKTANPLDRGKTSTVFLELEITEVSTDSAHFGWKSSSFPFKTETCRFGIFCSEILVLRHIKGSNFIFKTLTDVSDVG